ncbi:mitochondrial glutamate carrier 1-like isoform X2 [Tubulanus polymorphus]|uniref:mitochondrial glutamate carrier 1-like isoform X2 n=1 Tax=Tubulanus polymorphus TaxID=672921 RepID=UPI003DA2E0FE
MPVFAQGSGVNLLLITPEKAIKLVGNDFFRHNLKDKSGKLTLGRECLAGAGAGMCQIVVTTPMELLKIQLQDAGRTVAKGPVAKPLGINTGFNAPVLSRAYTADSAKPKLSATRIALTLIKEKGLLGLYKGCGATFLRDVTFSAIYFPMFANLNAMGKRREGSNEAVFYHSLLSGCTAGAIASLSVNPFDVVKTRLQLITKSQGDITYSGIIDCFSKTLSNEGIKAFFKGGACRMIVIAPLFGIAQTVYYMGVAEFLMGMPKP